MSQLSYSHSLIALRIAVPLSCVKLTETVFGFSPWWDGYPTMRWYVSKARFTAYWAMVSCQQSRDGSYARWCGCWAYESKSRQPEQSCSASSTPFPYSGSWIPNWCVRDAAARTLSSKIELRRSFSWMVHFMKAANPLVQVDELVIGSYRTLSFWYRITTARSARNTLDLLKE